MSVLTIKKKIYLFRPVDSIATTPYYELWGVLKGAEGDQALPNETLIEAEFKAPFLKTLEDQDFSEEFQLVEFSLKEAMRLIGGTFSPLANHWLPPAKSGYVFWEWVIPYHKGYTLKMYNAQIAYSITSPSDNPLAIRLKVTAMSTSDQVVNVPKNQHISIIENFTYTVNNSLLIEEEP